MPLFPTISNTNIVNVKDFGARGDGTGDDTAAIQAAIDSTTSKGTVYFPRGNYRVNSTIFITKNDTALEGDTANRYNGSTNFGSVLLFYGTGAVIQIGSDNGQPWNANLYDGPQGTRITNLSFKNNVVDTPLTNGLASYGAGSYGIRDWRGGGIVQQNVFFEGFEYSFWGVQSDISQHHNIFSLYSKYGFYLGPRSDQNTLYDYHPLLSDGALVIDQAVQTRVYAIQMVGCGTNVQYPIDIKMGTIGVIFDNPWFEFFQGYDGEVLAFVAAGINAGYNPALLTADDIALIHPQISTNTQVTQRRVKYLLAGDNCVAMAEQLHGNVNNLSKIFAAYGSANGQYGIKHIGVSVSSGNLIVNNGSGTPLPYGEVLSNGGRTIFSSNGRFVNQTDPLGGTQAELTWRLRADTQRSFIVDWPSSTAGGNLTRLQFSKRINPGTVAPATNTWDVGDYVYNTAPAEAGTAASKYVVIGWICTVAGTPGTWLPVRTLTGN